MAIDDDRLRQQTSTVEPDGQTQGSTRLPSSAGARAAQVAFHVAGGVLLALYVGFFVARCVGCIRCPYTLDYGEGLVLSQAVRLAHGETLYNDYTHYPFVFSNYPPLFIGLAAAGIKLFGVSFAFGRGLAFAAMLGVAVVMALILRRCGVGAAAALGAPAFLLSARSVVMWTGFMRVDSLSWLLSMGGLYCVLRRGRWLVGGVLLMVAAVFAKQSTVVGLGAAVVYLWWIGERRNAALFLASWAGAVLIVFAAFQVVTDGWFFRHIVTANVNPWFADRMWMMLKGTLAAYPVLFIMAAVSAVALLEGKRCADSACVEIGRAEARNARHCERALVPYFVLAAVSSVSVGKGGAAVNYMIEPLAAACLVAALGYQRLISAPRSRVAEALWAVTAVALMVQLIAMWYPPSVWAARREPAVTGGRAAAWIIARTKGEIVGDPPGAVVLSGRPLLLDPATASHMELMGVWNPAPLLRDIERRRFALIYMMAGAPESEPVHGLHQGKWSAEIMRAIVRNYREVGSAGALCFLTPRQATTGIAHPLRDRRGSEVGGKR
jgi:hypothetical protein